jgi:hypothetical protein
MEEIALAEYLFLQWLLPGVETRMAGKLDFVIQKVQEWNLEHCTGRV